MFFSIITVALNDLENLKTTYADIVSQRFEDYEYIVIDGVSDDGTLEYLEDISKLDSRVRYLSEKDAGIYNAMNKGIRMAQGEYIVFLGAGDTFYDENTLQDVFDVCRYDVVYGYGIFSSGKTKGEKIGSKLSFKGFLLDRVAAHQAVYVKTALMKRYLFREKYKIQADQDALMHMYKDGYRFHYFNKPLCYYDGLGFSSQENMREHAILERISMLKEYYPMLYGIRAVGHFILSGKRYELNEEKKE